MAGSVLFELYHIQNTPVFAHGTPIVQGHLLGKINYNNYVDIPISQF